MSDSEEVLIDARGHKCPVPTLRLRRALEGVQAGAVVRLLADDPMAKIDVPHFCNQQGFELIEAVETTFRVRKR
ncbi:MAG: sulfurtransferase TusA family protein [Parcubacteria group bacterium]